jgi:diaminobutyrate-2-oxoglutarate transaminase
VNSTPADVDDAARETESSVRSYCRSFPAVFTSAKGDLLMDRNGGRYFDFLAGAGSLNYGHNPDAIKNELIEYLQGDGLMHGLDMFTAAKSEFLEEFRTRILEPRGLDYKVQFTGPAGTNAVEAALKAARLSTGRTNVIAFSGGFHGVSTGALSATGSGYFRQGLETTLSGVTHVPYPVSPLGEFDSIGLLEHLLQDPSSGVEKPAAVLLETVQGEGGVWVAPVPFLKSLREFCDRHGILLVVDDIQAGCGRTGTFFSFERAGIVPDVVTLSKSIGAYGLPMALVLLKPEHDVWKPGQHNGTFRGNQLAFVAAAAALRHYWRDGEFVKRVRTKADLVEEFLQRRLVEPLGVRVRGIGLFQAVDVSTVPGLDANKVSRRCFEKGLIIESCGRQDEVLKIIPPLTISQVNLSSGLHTLADVLTEMADPSQQTADTHETGAV